MLNWRESIEHVKISWISISSGRKTARLHISKNNIEKVYDSNQAKNKTEKNIKKIFIKDKNGMEFDKDLNIRNYLTDIEIYIMNKIKHM